MSPYRSVVLRRVRLQAAITGTRLLSSRDYDPHDSIVICGGPRSGTTWLAQTIASIPGSGVLFEPLHPNRVPAVPKAGFTWRTYIRPGTDWPQGRHLLEQAFRGRILNAWTGSLLKRPGRVTTWIVKCIRANRLMPWMSEWMQPRARLLVIRHPCAVVSSQVASGWAPPDVSISPELLADYPQIRTVMQGCESPEEQRALDWAISTLVPLSHESVRRWLTVPYEHLVTGEVTFESIFSRWGIPVPSALADRAGAWSHTSRRRDERPDARITLTEWTKRLAPEQVSRILGVTHALGLDFYGEDPEPDPERLRRFIDPA